MLIVFSTYINDKNWYVVIQRRVCQARYKGKHPKHLYIVMSSLNKVMSENMEDPS